MKSTMKSTQKKVSGADLPTRGHGFIFHSAAWKNRILRGLRNLFQRVHRYKPQPVIDNARRLSESVSPLWSGEETAAMLVAGKIQNLRLSAKKLDGIVIPARQTFSFWKQTGRMTSGRRYARGRELREGCIIPAIGGGICQLSNAIYDAALRAGLEIVERHRHSQVIKGSLAEHDRDATVFWNYIDLRLRAPFTWQLQVYLDDKHLSVCILSPDAEQKSTSIDEKQLQPDAMGDCSRCGRTDCYLHVGDIPLHEHKTWLVTDEEMPEFTLYRKQNQTAQDKVITSSSRCFANFYSRLMRRIHLRLGHPLPVAQNSRYSRIAKALTNEPDASDTYLVIPQDLLPWLWMAGELRGRAFDVLMNALPVPDLQRRLDEAVKMYPQIQPLTNFRADEAFTQAESDALAAAKHWITPHAAIQKLAGNKAIILPWQMPEIRPTTTSASGHLPQIMLAAPSLARKGAYELAEALRLLSRPVQVLLLPRKPESPDIWQGLDVKHCASMSDGVRQADIVVLPAWVEHQPRGVLQAIALGKPVIVTEACGLPDNLPVDFVTAGNVEELKEAINKYLG
jgi:hypothetical protein